MNLGLKFVKEQFCPFSKNVCPLSTPRIKSDQIRADKVMKAANLSKKSYGLDEREG